MANGEGRVRRMGMGARDRGSSLRGMGMGLGLVVIEYVRFWVGEDVFDDVKARMDHVV